MKRCRPEMSVLFDIPLTLPSNKDDREAYYRDLFRVAMTWKNDLETLRRPVMGEEEKEFVLRLCRNIEYAFHSRNVTHCTIQEDEEDESETDSVETIPIPMDNLKTPQKGSMFIPK